MSKNKVIISDQLKDILNGYVMGDGYLNPQGTLTVDQGEKQLKFVEWLHEKLKPICTENSAIATVIRERKGLVLDKGSIKTKSYRFNTRAVLKEYYTNWYRPVLVEEEENPFLASPSKSAEGKSFPALCLKKTVIKKRLPLNIDEIFTPVFITVWFACDGTKILGSRGANFEVTSLSVAEREILKKLFKSKYDISVQIIRSGKSSTGKHKWAIAINSVEYDKFRSLITQIDLIQNLFAYKLHKKTS